MANRNFSHFTGSLDRAMVKLYGKVLLGNNVITSTDCLGFDVTRTGAGLYTVTLSDRFPVADGTTATTPLFGCDVQLIAAAAQTGTMRIVADNTATLKTFTLSWDVGGVSTDPATGGTFLMEITMRNTSAPRKGV